MPTQRYMDELTVGSDLEPISFGPVTTRQMVQWTAAAGDYHEIHYDKDYALAQGLPDIVVQGPMKMALMGRMLMELVGPKGWISRMTCRYTALDLPRTVLQITAKVTAVRMEAGEADLDLAVINETGKQTSTGTATVKLPSRT